VRAPLSVAQIARVIDRKRETHPELARALTWPAFLRICEREDVTVRKSRAPMPRMAQLVPYAGAWTIVLNCAAPLRRHLYLGTHELGHLWLHHDRAGAERWERVYNMEQHWPDDPREDDAELFAQLVLMGPQLFGPDRRRAETHVQHALRTMRVPRGPR
jgi:Zn-dependent peptidase ImmA (M78 family)